MTDVLARWRCPKDGKGVLLYLNGVWYCPRADCDHQQTEVPR